MVSIQSLSNNSITPNNLTAPRPPDRPRRRFVDNPDATQEPEVEAGNNSRRRYYENTEVPSDVKRFNENMNGTSGHKFNERPNTTAGQKFNAKSIWQAAGSSPK